MKTQNKSIQNKHPSLQQKLLVQNNYNTRYNRLILVIFISILFIAAEVTLTLLSHSIALIAVPVQLATDLIAFLFALLFLSLSRKTPNVRMTFGYNRMELFGALFNLFVVWVLILYVIYQGIQSILNKSFVEKPLYMLAGAVGGFVINLIMYKVMDETKKSDNILLVESQCDHPHGVNSSSNQINCKQDICHNQECNTSVKVVHCHKDQSIHRHQKQNGDQDNILNQEEEEDYQRYQNMGMQAAVIQISSNMAISIGLILASLVIFLFGTPNGYIQDVYQWNDWHLADPIFAFIFAVITIACTISVLRQVYFHLMDSTPSYLDINILQKAFQSVKGVIDVHDLHVWDLRPGKIVAIAHVLAKKDSQRQVLIGLSDIARQKKIFYSTFQVQEEVWKDEEDYILCHHDIH